MKVKLFVTTGFAGCEHIDYVDVPDDITEDELNEMAREFMMGYIDYGFITEHQAREYGYDDFEEESE